MKYFIPIDSAITDSNIAVDEGTNGTIYPYVLVDGYAQGVQRYYINRLWEAFATIDPLAEFDWNDLDPLDLIATNLHTETVIDETAVVIIVDDVVFQHSTAIYYKNKVPGTKNFTTEDFTNGTNWEDLTIDALYRHLYNKPTLDDSIYWKDLGATNRNKCVDKAVNSQSTKNDTEMYFEFEVKNINKVTLFNLEAETATITLFDPLDYNPDTESGTYIYKNIKSDLQNYDSIINWRTLSQYETSYVRSIDWTLPFFTGELTVRISLESASASDLKLGEILIGQTQELAITIDGLPIGIKSSGKIIQQDNGDIIFEDEGDTTKIFHLFNFSLSFDSFAIDSVLDKCDAMINRRIVVFGENKDDGDYRSLVVYGFSREASPVFTEGNEKSKIKLQVQRFN